MRQVCRQRNSFGVCYLLWSRCVLAILKSGTRSADRAHYPEKVCDCSFYDRIYVRAYTFRSPCGVVKTALGLFIVPVAIAIYKHKDEKGGVVKTQTPNSAGRKSET